MLTFVLMSVVDKQAADNAQAWQAYYQQFYNSNQQVGPQGGTNGQPQGPPQPQNPVQAPGTSGQPQVSQAQSGYPAPSKSS